MIETVVIDSIDGIMRLISDQAYNEDIGRLRSAYFFRGLPDVRFRLTTSLRMNCKELHRELLLLALLGAFTGVLAGGCAVIFRYMIAFFHNLAFRGTVSLHYDALAHADPSPWGIGIILIPLAGALLVAFLVRNFAPGARSHGVPQIMYSIYYREAKIHPVLALIKSLSASISIGTGASIGREGPIIQITASVGSAIGG